MDERGWYTYQTVFLTLLLCLSRLFVRDAVYFEGQLGKLDEVLFPTLGLGVWFSFFIILILRNK